MPDIPAEAFESPLGESSTVEGSPKLGMDAVQAAIAQGRAIVCWSRCWACQFGYCPEPPRAHTWMDKEDAEHAGHPWPLPDETAAKHPCACPCAKDKADA